MTMQSVFESGSMTTILSWMMAWPALKSSLWKSPMRSLMAAARIISTLGAPFGEKMAGGGILGFVLSFFWPGGGATKPGTAVGSLMAPITMSFEARGAVNGFGVGSLSACRRFQ